LPVAIRHGLDPARIASGYCVADAPESQAQDGLRANEKGPDQSGPTLKLYTYDWKAWGTSGLEAYFANEAM
jgi:hypothetical protein